MKRCFKRTFSILLTVMMIAVMFTFLTTTATAATAAIQFYVTLPRSDLDALSLNTDSEATVREVKTMITNQIGGSDEALQLRYGSTILEDDKTLGDYDIVEGATINVLPYPFSNHSVALDEDICINFYFNQDLMYIPDSEEDPFYPIDFTFEWVGEDTPSTDITVNNVTVTEENYENYYDDESSMLKIPCCVFAAEIASPVKVSASITYDADTSITYSNTYSVKDYAMNIITNSNNYPKRLVNLAAQLLNYGAAAQQLFNVNTDNPANGYLEDYETVPVTASMIKSAINMANTGKKVSSMSSGTSDFGLKYYGTTLVLEGTVTLRHYYRITNAAAYEEAKETAEGFVLNESKPGYVIYEKKGIPAAEWNKYQVFTIGGKSYNYSVLDYLMGTLKAGSEAMKTLAAEAYWLNQAANEYFRYVNSFGITIDPMYFHMIDTMTGFELSSMDIKVTSGGKTIRSGDKLLPGEIVCVEFYNINPFDENCILEVATEGENSDELIPVPLFSDKELRNEVNNVTYGTVYFEMPEKNVAISSLDNGFCLAEGTMITLADGTKKAVEEITKGDELLVWNLETGSYDTAPVIFNVQASQVSMTVIHTCFSDGTDVWVAREHGFFDLDLGEYVFINENTLNDYIGDTFVKIGDTETGTWQTVTLDKVWTETKVLNVYSPVTAEQYCCFTEDILSVSGSFQGLVNIFDVDTDNLKFDSEKMQADIDAYGLFDYKGIVPYDIFNAFNGKWINVAVGKGITTLDYIYYMAASYANYF